ncbi:2-phospho-L-lactate transferase CofD family protein [Oscillochloris sp. ZM17-4]|uniref:gluconeogenesis factor YvcK family protein n=1 Tax=Oscillochloris sp. ZM17-4 TaxID=2866714 RepID=UPI001C72DEFC|nr:2-phospho-L-lactate transferase CofD family protein [Oscillochloris sp. ZM17-4]MBX0331196.1 2-phospho-L-lactate transferase CofD family protein [Oscillochloris sp. ZM17-4]
MRSFSRRLVRLSHLVGALTAMIAGVALILFGLASLLALQLAPVAWRDALLIALGLAAIGYGLWRLSGLVVLPLDTTPSPDGELVVGFRRAGRPPQVVVLSGGAGMLVLSGLGDHVERMTCIVPAQDPVEYYYRAAGLFNFQNVYYVVPTPVPLDVRAEIDDGTLADVRHLALNPQIAEHHVSRLYLGDPASAKTPLPRLVAEAIRDADAIILGPGSLFESVVPNMLIDAFREALAASAARKLYVCNLMTEPGRTTGFSVADHIRTIKRYAGFAPDYVLVNAQRIDSEIHRLYAAANQSPVYLAPDEYEETAVLPGDRDGQRRVVIEGSVVIEADLASSVIQYTATLDNPNQSRAVHVLRHDGDKLTATVLELLRRT